MCKGCPSNNFKKFHYLSIYVLLCADVNWLAISMFVSKNWATYPMKPAQLKSNSYPKGQSWFGCAPPPRGKPKVRGVLQQRSVERRVPSLSACWAQFTSWNPEISQVLFIWKLKSWRCYSFESFTSWNPGSVIHLKIVTIHILKSWRCYSSKSCHHLASLRDKDLVLAFNIYI